MRRARAGRRSARGAGRHGNDAGRPAPGGGGRGGRRRRDAVQRPHRRLPHLLRQRPTSGASASGAHNTDEGCGPTQTPGEGEEGGTGAEGAPKNVTISDRNLQKVFDKHGDDFGLSGNWNPGRADDVRNAILDHINSPSVQRISGTYRGMQVTHVVDPNTGLNVILDGAGNFIGGWKLSAEQLQSVLNGGRLF